MERVHGRCGSDSDIYRHNIERKQRKFNSHKGLYQNYTRRLSKETQTDRGDINANQQKKQETRNIPSQSSRREQNKHTPTRSRYTKNQERPETACYDRGDINNN